MTYMDILNQNENNFSERDFKRVGKVFQKMDEKNISLETLSKKQYAEIVTEGYKDIALGIYSMRSAYNGLKFLYKFLNITPPDDIKNMTINDLLENICQVKQEWNFFKTIEDVIAHVDKLNWDNFCADAKAAYVLAWHGISTKEMADIKKSDFNFEQKTLKIPNHNLIFFTDFEINVIREYCNLEWFSTPTQERKMFLIRSDYLFRPCEGQGIRPNTNGKMTDVGIRTKLQKVNNGLTEKHFLPRITVKSLLTNGDFYRAYTTGLSKHIFDMNRKVQYEQYVKVFWEEEGDE